MIFNNSIKDAANTIWAHWNHSDLPAVTVDPDAPKPRVYFFRDEGMSGSMLPQDPIQKSTGEIGRAARASHRIVRVRREAA